MSPQPRYFKNLKDPLLTVADPHVELLKSLERLVTNCPPIKPWTHGDCPEKGLLTGPTSLAYLFLKLSHVYPNLSVKDRTPMIWCLAYLNCGQSSTVQDARGADRVGVTNEYLSFRAVRAAATADELCIANLEAAATLTQTDPSINEYLYGRAGLLALLRIVSTFVPAAKERMQKAMRQVIPQVLANAPWTFHGHEYLGAAHGSIGIIAQVVLSDPEYAKNAVISDSLEKLLDLQLEEGNWPTTPEHNQGLTQWCHGAPGFVVSLLAMKKYFSKEAQVRIDRAVENGRKCIWEYGLLTKEPNLCHGVTGNALSLESRENAHFLAHSTTERIEEGLSNSTYIKGDDPWGLMWGEGGRAWGWLSLASGHNLGYPAYTDI